MKSSFLRPSFLGISAMLIATCAYAGAQVSPQNTQETTPQKVQLVSANAQLVQRLDSKNATQGQTVSAELTSDVKAADGVKLDKGTVLMGKVEQVQRSNDKGPSQLSIVFDQARLKDGHTIPVKATLLGAYPASTGSFDASGNLLAQQPHFIPTDQKIDQLPGTLSHVAMQSAVQSKTSGTFVSKDRDIKLGRGTQLQIAISPLTAGQETAG